MAREKDKKPRKFIAVAPGYLNKIFSKGEVVPKHLMPKRGASWISEVLEDGTKQPSLETMKKGKKKKAKVKQVVKPVVDQDLGETKADDSEINLAEVTKPNDGTEDIDKPIQDAYESLDPADDSHWNADGSVGIRNLNKLHGTTFTSADLDDDMNREALTLLKSDG